MNETPPSSKRLAVLIDAENANADLVESLLKEIAKYGVANVKRIYGDWTDSHQNKWKNKLNKFAIQPIQQFRYTTGKNSTDSALIIDAMDLLYTGNFDGFCIVSSDSDFTRLACRIRESGLVVYGFGEKKTPEAFISACDRFVYTEILSQIEEVPVVEQEENNKVKEKDKEISKIPASQTAKETGNDQNLKINKKLIKLFKDAYDAIAEEEEWAHLGAFGGQLTKLSPSFDSRNYGYKKLSDLIRAIDIFEIKKTPNALHIKLKS
jgi:uncharacterized LabA/DUF88 family protein